MWKRKAAPDRLPATPAWATHIDESRFSPCVIDSSAHPTSTALSPQRKPSTLIPRPQILITASALVAVMVIPSLKAWAARPAQGVVEALERKYQVTAMTPDDEQITKDGTTMVMKSAGIFTLPSSLFVEPENTVVDGAIKPSSAFVRMTWTRMGSHVLQSGDKVYITKIETKNGSSDQLRFTIVTVDSLDVSGQDAQKKYKAVVSFKFKGGYLDEAPPEEVEQAIEAIMAPDTGSDDAQQGGNSGNGNQSQGQAQGPANPPPPRRAAVPPPPPAAPAGPPPTITIGESSTEVLQAMGMPAQMIDLGKKKTYIYKNMKVIFVDDKVSDVQ
jgi:hypothetical protein